MKNLYTIIIALCTLNALAQIPSTEVDRFEQKIEHYSYFAVGNNDPEWIKNRTFERTFNTDYSGNINRKSYEGVMFMFMHGRIENFRHTPLELSYLEEYPLYHRYFSEVKSTEYYYQSPDYTKEEQYRNIFVNDTLYSYGAYKEFEEDTLYFEFLGTYTGLDASVTNDIGVTRYSYKDRLDDTEMSFTTYQTGYIIATDTILYKIDKTDDSFIMYVDTLNDLGMVRARAHFKGSDSSNLFMTSYETYVYNGDNRIIDHTTYTGAVDAGFKKISEDKFVYGDKSISQKFFNYTTYVDPETSELKYSVDSSEYYKAYLDEDETILIVEDYFEVVDDEFRLVNSSNYSYNLDYEIYQASHLTYQEQTQEYYVLQQDITDSTSVLSVIQDGIKYPTDSIVIIQNTELVTNTEDFTASHNVVALVPNPASDHFQIINYTGNDVILVEIVNMQGVVVKSLKANASENVQLDDISSGLYIINLYESGGKKIKQEKLQVL